jgi:hypothetical protein
VLGDAPSRVRPKLIGVRPYAELPELTDIVLEESYVLGVTALPGQVTFDVEFVLTPDHPSYVPPPPSENECFRRGTLRLFGVRRLTWDDQGRPPATDATGERDFGHVDRLSGMTNAMSCPAIGAA